MINKQKVIKFLYDNEFTISDTEIYQKYDRDFTFLSDGAKRNNLIIKKYKTYNEEKIIEDVIKLRAFLRNNNLNIWNSYFFILLQDNDLKNQNLLYNIEKNTLGIRKYLILEENDLLRLPFIKQNMNKTTHEFNLSKDLETPFEDTESKARNLIEWLLQNDGDSQNIKRQRLKYEVMNIFLERGKADEN